jgi:hypothetical protein
MKRAKIDIEIIQNDKGIIFIKFLSDGCIYPIKDCMENIGIISALEVELEYELKKSE